MTRCTKVLEAARRACSPEAPGKSEVTDERAMTQDAVGFPHATGANGGMTMPAALLPS